jgi:predicted nuclease with TOPRIM domain
VNVAILVALIGLLGAGIGAWAVIRAASVQKRKENDLKSKLDSTDRLHVELDSLKARADATGEDLDRCRTYAVQLERERDRLLDDIDRLRRANLESQENYAHRENELRHQLDEALRHIQGRP